MLNGVELTKYHFESMKGLLLPLLRSRSSIYLDYKGCSVKFFFSSVVNRGQDYRIKGKVKISISQFKQNVIKVPDFIISPDEFFDMTFESLIELLDKKMGNLYVES